MERLFFLDHSPINFHFRQSPSTFVVEEVPLYEFSGEGEHLILKVRKKGLTTWDMLKIFSERVGIKLKDIGYAGLKDKNALTYQYISVHKKFQKEIESFEHELIKIIDITRHKNKIKIGHLKGNRFFIRLKKVMPIEAKKIENVALTLQKVGMPNYFGYQRFGNDEKNYILGEALVKKSHYVKERKKRRFLINAYQSMLFNNWLSKRVEISKLCSSFSEKELSMVLDFSREDLKVIKNQPQFFKIFPGDILSHYPFGKLFEAQEAEVEAVRFQNRDITVTGLLPGKKTKRATKLARAIEREFDDERIEEFGDRRFAWIYPQEIRCEYDESNAWMELRFFLPKGSYATVLLEEIAHRKLKE